MLTKTATMTAVIMSSIKVNPDIRAEGLVQRKYGNMTKFRLRVYEHFILFSA